MTRKLAWTVFCGSMAIIYAALYALQLLVSW